MLFDRKEPTVLPFPARQAKHERAMWSHECVAEKANVFTVRGEPCSWCGARERQ